MSYYLKWQIKMQFYRIKRWGLNGLKIPPMPDQRTVAGSALFESKFMTSSLIVTLETYQYLVLNSH